MYVIKLQSLLFSLLLFLSVLSCKKEKQTAQDATFVFYKASTSGNWSVLIDGIDHGAVPYTISAPNCTATSAGLKVIKMPGNYRIDFKNHDGFAWGNPKSVSITAGECKPYKLQ